MTAMKILVPLDGSQFAEWALPYAIWLAETQTAEIELVSVYDKDPTVGGWPLSTKGVEEWFTAYLDGVRERLITHTTRPVTTVMLPAHHVAKTVERHARDADTNLIVMSTHGRGPLARAWIGSVADHIVRHATQPVLLVRPAEDTAPPIDAPVTFQRLLVPLDGSPLAERALPWAERIAAVADAALTLLRAVLPPMNVQSPYLPHTIAETRDTLDEGRRAADAYLGEVATHLARRGRRVSTELQVGVRPATAILHYVERNPVDLIALATHGRGGLTRAVLGSVADKVVRGSSVPVLLARAHDTDTS